MLEVEGEEGAGIGAGNGEEVLGLRLRVVAGGEVVGAPHQPRGLRLRVVAA